MSSLSVGLMGEAPENGDGQSRPLYGVMTGRVINVLDPLQMGRVQVQLPNIDSLDPLPWARIVMPWSAMMGGVRYTPSINDEVLLAFENGDPNCPVVLGCLPNVTCVPPPLPPPLPGVPRMGCLRTLLGTQIFFDDTPGKMQITLQVASPPTPPLPPIPAPAPAGPVPTVCVSTAGVQASSPVLVSLQGGTSGISISEAGIIMTCGGTTVAITAAGVVITSPNVSITGSETLTLFGAQVFIN